MAITGYEVVSHSASWTANDNYIATSVMAPSGKKVLGGGFDFAYSDNRTAGVKVIANRPYPYPSFSAPDGGGWQVSIVPDGVGESGWPALEGTLRVWAMCADV